MSSDVYQFYPMDENETESPELWLGEELLLLALKDRSGYCSFFNSSISSAIRGCILIELWLTGRIALAESTMLPARKRVVVVKSAEPLGHSVLDEALANIVQSTERHTVATWISVFNGDSWNPFKFNYQLKNVRERLAKDLVEKGVLRHGKQDFWVLEVPTHPLAEMKVKQRVVKKVQHALLSGWNKDLARVEPRLLSLVVLASAGEVMDLTLDSLPDDERDIAMKRLQDIENINFNTFSKDSSALHWPVFHYFFG